MNNSIQRNPKIDHISQEYQFTLYFITTIQFITTIYYYYYIVSAKIAYVGAGRALTLFRPLLDVSFKGVEAITRRKFLGSGGHY